MVDRDAFDLNAYRTIWQERIDLTITELVTELAAHSGCPDVLSQAIGYAMLPGGKRLRPLLCLAALRSTGGVEEEGLRPACSLEFVHAYSLVHDDLPAMDDDDFRRGKPSCHKIFGEATAILAGDALLTYAFEILAKDVKDDRLAAAVMLLAASAGAGGMVGGQVEDVRADQKDLSVEVVEHAHMRKTGVMFEASVCLGGLIGRASNRNIDAFSKYGRAFGLAYQIVDDVLEFRGQGDLLGKPTGSDQAKDRRTHPRIVGVHKSVERARQLLEEANSALENFGSEADALRHFVDQIGKRVDVSSPL